MLTDTTILENITYGEKNISLENVEAAAKKAHIYDFIKNTENGFLTKIGERGIRISGGQRQKFQLLNYFILIKKYLY